MNVVEELRDLHTWLESSTEPTQMDNGDDLLHRTLWLDVGPVSSGGLPLLKLYDKPNTQWVTVGPVALSELSDVDLAGGSEGDVLTQQADGSYAPADQMWRGG